MEDKKLIEIYNYISKFKNSYTEVFNEYSIRHSYSFIDNKLDIASNTILNGTGITINDGLKKYYLNSNNYDTIDKQLEKLTSSFKLKDEYKDVTFEKKEYTTNNKHDISDKEKKDLLNKINKYCRQYSDKVYQVNISLVESNQIVKIINCNGFNVEKRILTRMAITLLARDENGNASASTSPGYNKGYETILKNWETFAKAACDDVLDKLKAVSFKGGNMPVVIGPGFGAVIFHEACGHAMESYSIVNDSSVLCGKLNTKIASDKVTIIDDGTIKDLYGTSRIDDQGTKTKKNILIENGILKNYLTDIPDADILNSSSTGSARRESYHLPATSRMNNTYLDVGNDSFEDMIKSIEYGLYAKSMGGGSVSPSTGEFNFTVNLGYIIENGKITKPVKNVSLIGDALDILSKVEMVDNKLDFDPGMCGSMSGSVPVTTGQPNIKVSSILVGGNINE